ncbi:hypothetical protein AVEN_189543-1 [Araneus ventricosus]|uniref:Uncharacterized protein n=1 Tax=Araneus ventricosus TaxID=182803 RepID=A0A4Y2PS40_ARAVE|nr:hypothetical protein AVEN_189543-1 [Araneus ventricosus]
MNWSLPTWVVFTPPPHYPAITLPYGARKWAVVGKAYWSPPTALIPEAISEPHLPSKEANRLRPAFVAVERTSSNCPRPPRLVR